MVVFDKAYTYLHSSFLYSLPIPADLLRFIFNQLQKKETIITAMYFVPCITYLLVEQSANTYNF